MICACKKKKIKIILDYNVSHIPLISRNNKRNIIHFVTKEVYRNNNKMRNYYLYYLCVVHVDFCWPYNEAGSELYFFHTWFVQTVIATME